MTLAHKSDFQPTPHFRAKRHSKLARLQLTAANSEPIAIIISNISATGLNATAHGPAPQIGEVVQVTLPDSRIIWGIIRWSEAGKLGGQFGLEFAPDAPHASQSRQIAP
jgi:hypothetical protein